MNKRDKDRSGGACALSKEGRNHSLRPEPTTENLFFLLLYNSRTLTRRSVTSVDTFCRLIGVEAET